MISEIVEGKLIEEFEIMPVRVRVWTVHTGTESAAKRSL